jgi:signal transduction histidine kinase
MQELSTARILVVDDEVSQTNALCEILREHGHEATGAITGQAAITLLLDQRFDLILTDLMMQGMDGITFLKAALAIDPSLVGIMMTGEGSIATAVEAMRVGAFDYILKPFKMGVILPVIARALAVRQLRLENSELTRGLIQRTAELEVANKDLEAFSATISHDLRGPLRAINGFSAILLEDHGSQLPPDGQQLLSTIIDSSKQMNRLIDDLLRFSRLGQQPLSQGSVGVADLFRKVWEELYVERAGRDVQIQMGDLPNCICDRALLKQVVVNLLSNALKFTSQRDQALIEIGCDAQPGSNVYFVRDNGAGFEMKNAPELFGVFQRFHSEKEFEGTGVGLSIVKRIIERHGGRIWAEGELNKGATFYFVLSENETYAASPR